ncbi:MAG: aminotransferase class III-fold pyridoxal phosphate-dependent enzyme [Planctomycetota bacterium]|nr:aminotransferase class III-fold pyridoxal phosphate-dependent enzyme [Planctomycetota bacterium]
MAKILNRRGSPDSYDAGGEMRRIRYADVIVRGRRINRGTAQVAVHSPVDDDETAAVRAGWRSALLPTTLAADAPVLHLDWPGHGPFVLSPHGTYFDAYLGVAQKLIDERHPNFVRMLRDLEDAGVLLRREIVTDDYVTAEGESRVRTARDLANLWARACAERFETARGYEAFFSASGAEAVEAALKICFQVTYKRFLERHGAATFARVQQELGFAEEAYFAGDPGLTDHPVYADYPFQLVACEGAFHGRTLGALSLTWSKKAHRLSYPKAWNVHHVPFNAPGDVVRERIDWRPIDEILATPGELARVLREQRRIPKDLFAGFLAEPFQGEGGYVPGDPAFFAGVRAVCDETGGLLCVDEVQTIGRTGTLLMTEQLGIVPDVICTAKSMVIGVTLARAEYAAYCHEGWHSNTWGAGRVLDTNFAYTTLDTLLHHRDPVFDGLSYLENVQVKGRQLSEGLVYLAEKHPDVLVGERGRGLMRAMLVRKRADVVRVGWQHGVKLLGCGWAAEVAPVRLLMLADTLGREVDELLSVLDRVFTKVKAGA